jgi:shikimate dehydrogenase
MSTQTSPHTCGLIGTTIARSLSPAMHNAAFAHHGLPDRYALWSVSEADLPARIAALRMPGMRGANVTIPHKSAVLPLLDELGTEPDVAALGAANTIVRREDGSLLGLNTDAEGFLRALKAAEYDPGDQEVVLLGAGGSARAVAWRLLHYGIRSLTIVNRSPDRAAELLADLYATIDLSDEPRLYAIGVDDDLLPEHLASAGLLVNATPVGADGHALPIPADLIHSGLFVCDLIYRPTPLLRAAAERGARTQDGLEMLVHQGALAFEAWTGLGAPIEIMRRAALEARGLQEQP